MRKEIVELYKKYGFNETNRLSQNMFYKRIIDEFIDNNKEYKILEIPNKTGIAYSKMADNEQLWFYNTISNRNYIQKELFDKISYTSEHRSQYVNAMVNLLDMAINNTRRCRYSTDSIYTNIRNFYDVFTKTVLVDHAYKINKDYNLYMIYRIIDVDGQNAMKIEAIYFNRNRFKADDIYGFTEFINNTIPYELPRQPDDC